MVGLNHHVRVPRTCEIQRMSTIGIHTDKLALSYSMRQLKPRDGSGCTSETLKAFHGQTFQFDRSMVLFDDVV